MSIIFVFQVRYAMKEYAATAVDVVARRLRLAFLNVNAAEEALPRIIEIMADELKWSKAEQKRQMELAMDFLKYEMGKDANRAVKNTAPMNLSREEVKKYIKQFQKMDVDKTGFICINNIREALKVFSSIE